MATRCLFAARCVLVAVLASPVLAAVPLKSLQYGIYSATVQSFDLGGVSVPPPAAPCTSPKFPDPCHPVVKADEDSVRIAYGPVAGQTLPAGATVSIVGCYSNYSSLNRPWRANGTATDVLTDKSCHFKIASKLPAATPGVVTFKPNDESPSSTVFIRVYVYSSPTTPIGYVNAPGFFQIQKISTPSHSVKAAAIGMCFAGPVILAIALPLDTFLTKRRKHH